MMRRALAILVAALFAGPALAQQGAISQSSGLLVGSSPIGGGTTTRILYDNAGVLGEYTVSGTGTAVCLVTSCVMVTPTLGVATGTSLGLTSTATSTQTLAANTSGDGFILTDPGPATVGNQFYSPRLRLTGAGWKTTGTASVVTDVILENQPVQGSANPSTNLALGFQIAGGGYIYPYTFSSGPSSATLAMGTTNRNGNITMYNGTTGNTVQITTASGALFGSGMAITWDSSATLSGTTVSTLSQASSGVLQVGTTASNALGSMLMAGLNVSGATIVFNGLATDAAATDVTLCSKSADGTLLKGSGTLGICLGTSSARFKTDIRPIEVGLDEVLALPVNSFYLDEQHGDPTRQMYGPTAEDCAKVLPTLTRFDREGLPNTCDYLGIVPVLIRAMQQQHAQIEELKRKLH